MKDNFNAIMQDAGALRDVLPMDQQHSIVAVNKYVLNGIQTLENLEEKLTAAMAAMEVPGAITLNNNSSSHE